MNIVKSIDEAEKEARERFNLGDDFHLERTQVDMCEAHDRAPAFITLVFYNINGEEVKVRVVFRKQEPQEGELWECEGKIGIVANGGLNFYNEGYLIKRIKLDKLNPTAKFIAPKRTKGHFKEGDIVSFWGTRCTVVEVEVPFNGKVGALIVMGIFKEKTNPADPHCALVHVEKSSLLIPVEARAEYVTVTSSKGSSN